MPKLVDSDGNVILDGLKKGELETLEANGVEFDVPEKDLPSDSSDSEEELEDEDEPDEIVKTEMPEPGGDGEEGPSEPMEEDIDGGKAEHHIDDERVEEFEDRDEEEIEHEYDVRLDEIDKVDDRDRARWANLIKQLHEYGDEVEIRKRERDSRIESKSWRSGRDHESLRQRAERKGVIEDLKQGFRQMVSRPTPKPAVQGPQMDPSNVARRAAGDVTIRELFEEEVVVETGDRCIGLATDISGSMGSSIDELKIAGGCIAEATDIIGDEFVWEAFTDDPGVGERGGGLDLRIVNGPSEDWDWEHVDSFGSSTNEPTAAGIRDCRVLMDQTSAREYVMIVITDGMALVTEDGRFRPHSGEPVEHAREAVNECRAAGIDVIGLGIGDMDDSKMEATFGGNNYRLTSIDNLAEDILELYAEQMNVNRGGF